MDLHGLWSSSNLDASRCKFLPFGHPVHKSPSQVICCYKNALTNDMCESYGFLRLVSRLANPSSHPSQVCMQVLVLQTCVDLRVYLATLCKSVRKFWFCKLASTCIDLRIRLVTLASQVCTQVLILQTCIDLHRLASPFGQGLRRTQFMS